MCGICGVYNYRSLLPVREEDIARMCNIMIHRGPDEYGIMAKNNIGLGHQRLSIIDLMSGHQPMFNDDRTICIVFNGEIYNYLELKEDLLKRGKTFRTTSDTEVLISMYEMYGENCLKYLNGMFAFAIWDNNNNRLFLARDRVGIKPLYYVESQNGIAFASEIKSLLQLPFIDTGVNLPSVDYLFSYGYTLGEESLFKGVLKVMPGEYICIEDKRLKKEKYWDVDFHTDEGKDENYYVEQLNNIFEDSVRLQLRSDVPVGVFLSGGVDSSAVVAYLHKMLKRQIKTFSVSFDQGKDFDESPYAALIAKKFETDHYHFYLSPEKYVEFIPELVWYLEEPIAEAPAISLYYVSKLASEHVKVVLSGEGSDELFAGYPKYNYFINMERLQLVPQFLKGSILSGLAYLTSSQKLKRINSLLNTPLDQRYLGGHSLDLVFRDILYSDVFKEQLNAYDLYAKVRAIYAKTKKEDILNRMLYLDQKTWLVDNLLLKADRMSMANSLELRVPFLDHRMVEFAATVPPNLKLRGNKTKYILKRALEGILPQEILFRKKMGFPVPLAQIFRSQGRDFLMDTLFSSKAEQRGYFNYNFIRRIVDEHMSNKSDHRYLLWQLLLFESWNMIFIDGDGGK